MTQKIKKSPIHGCPTTMAMFSHASPSAIMPKKLSIQYTGNVPWPYATGLPVVSQPGLFKDNHMRLRYLPYSIIVTCVSEVMGLVPKKLIWNAIDTKLYAKDRNRYAVMVAAHRQAMS